MNEFRACNKTMPTLQNEASAAFQISERLAIAQLKEDAEWLLGLRHDDSDVETKKATKADDDSSETSSSSSSSVKSLDDDDAAMFTCVRCADTAIDLTEQDEWLRCAESLSSCLRERPTLPASWKSPSVSFKEVETAVRLPLYSCPFKNCRFAVDNRIDFLRHFQSADEKVAPHGNAIREVCGTCFSMASQFDWMCYAISILERRNFPLIGMATTRRALRTLITRFNDEEIKSLVCMVCGQIHTTARGPEHITEDGKIKYTADIQYWGRDYFSTLEKKTTGHC